MSFIAALHTNAQRVRQGLLASNTNPFLVASWKETVGQYKTLAGDLGSSIGAATFDWQSVHPMTGTTSKNGQYFYHFE